MSFKRRDIIRYLQVNGFFFQREGGNHTIYTNSQGVSVPVVRHNTFSRTEANRICREAGIPQIF
ncbi:MAG: type II toxin-antitoxin system HicA family toxin [Synergistaceae bacterium]|nr:type II toxin-antitoxin system HicA family toxin [Synergistaceae bacterium]